MPIARHLNVIFRNAKTPRNAPDFVQCQSGVQRLTEKLLAVLAFLAAIGRHKSFDRFFVFRPSEIPNEKPPTGACQADRSLKTFLGLIEVMKQAVADDRVGDPVLVRFHAFDLNMAERNLPKAARDVDFPFCDFQHLHLAIGRDDLIFGGALTEFNRGCLRDRSQDPSPKVRLVP